MAPLKPSSKAKRSANSLAVKQRTTYPANRADSAFTTTKKDKQLMRHSLFMSKVHDAGVKKQKRRRPGKKLVTNLDSLEDAIQDVEQGSIHQPPQMKNVREGRGQAKRKEKVVMEERARFAKNIATLSTSTQDSNSGTSATIGKFAALRAHILAGMSSDPTMAGPS